MRLFLGIFPPKDHLDYFRDVLRELSKEKRNIKPVSLDNVHLTLRYIGSKVSPKTKELLADALQRRAHNYPKPEVIIESLDFGFAHQDDPRVLMATITPTYELDDLVDTIHKEVRTLKRKDTILWKEDTADYHISIARLKPNAPRAVGRRIQPILDTIKLEFPEPFVANEMYLVQSELTRTGPVYKKLDKIML